MKLRRIDILGFKSFKDRVRVDLSDGMTAIVGPNGCGKSNVVDAIKWAMGDMSPKSLRGSSMEDVIFAGSEGHKPMGLAEVTLTFENDGALEHADIEWGDALPRELRNLAEISVTRRLHRSGDSEYLINKTACRLMDIQNLLAGTGVGKQGYSIIEQNKVGFIVSAKPSERRLLIEEASGITRYKGQRDRAERRLVKAEDNLQRVDDILGEVNKQIRSLERQAKRAARYRELAEELRSLEIALLVARRSELSSEVERLDELIEAAAQSVERLKGAIRGDDETLNSAKVEAFQTEKKHAEATEAFYRLDTKLNLARSRAEHAAVSLQEANRRLGSSEREQENQQKRKVELEQELASVVAELESLEDTAGYEAELAQVQDELASLKERVRDRERARTRVRHELDEARSELGRIEDRLGWIGGRRRELTERQQRIEASVEEASSELGDLERRVEELSAQREVLGERLEQAVARREKLEETLKALRDRAGEAERELSRAKARRIELETRVGGLEAMRERGEGYDDAVQKVMEWARTGERGDILGPLGDFLDVESEREQAVAMFLGERIGDVVVTSRDAAFDALDVLGDFEGTVAFWIVDVADGDRAGVADAVVAMLEDLTVCSARDEIPAELSAGEAWAVSSGAIVFGEGRILAGSDERGRSVLRQRRMLRELEAELAEATKLESEAVARHDALRQEVSTLRQKAQLARQESETLQLELRTKSHDLTASERELDRAKKGVDDWRAQLVPIFKSQEELKSEEAELAEKRESLQKVVDDSKGELEALGAGHEELQEKLEVLQSDVTERRIRLAEIRERHRNLGESRARLTRSLESSAKLIEKYGEEARQQSERITELQSTIDVAESELKTATEDREKSKAAVDAAKKALDAANEAVGELELRLRDKRDAIGEKVEARQQLEFSRREAALGVEHVEEQLRERYELSPHQAQRVAEGVQTPHEERKGKRDYLRKRLDSLGPVNPMAEEEYAEALERQSFLSEQKQDLETAVADLRQAIAKMDRESRRRFKETFDRVNAKFQEIFPSLFRGGRAELILTDPDDMLNTGIDIHVQPPGKRNQSVTLLSGGEKALTAVSLIFSIFMLKPTPFSILDEVDAPLDEANVGRFAQLVRNLSGTSQMIVITHSRRTMEESDVLYGVTMEQPGVSKIVSVRLSDVDDKLAS